MPKFEFDNQYVPQNFIEIENIGNVCIEAINENDGLFYYLLIKTSLGTTSIFEYGPVIPDIDKLFDSYNVSFNREQYNEKKLKIFISKWLNDRMKKITAANIIEEKIFLDNYRDICYTIGNYGNEVY